MRIANRSLLLLVVAFVQWSTRPVLGGAAHELQHVLPTGRHGKSKRHGRSLENIRLRTATRCRRGGSSFGSWLRPCKTIEKVPTPSWTEGIRQESLRAWGRERRLESGDVGVAAEASQAAAVVDVRGGSTASASEAYRTALLRTCLLFACAGAFGLGTMVVKGKKAALEFFTGYIVEQSLSVDNLFIFIMLFDYFKVPEEFQPRVLKWGIIGAMSMRAVMIVVGVAAIQRFRWVMLFFSGILVVSSLNLLMEKDDDHGDSSHLENNGIMKVAKWMCDSVDYYDGENFFTMVDGVKKATPLLLCLICIELSDFVFAVDSIPAVLGISHDTFIVYASNVFAICAMRSIYTLVSHAISDLPYLKPAVALVLGFVGAKMCAEFFHYNMDVGLSLGVVCGILAAGAIASVISNRRRNAAKATSLTGEGSDGLTFKSIPAGGASFERAAKSIGGAADAAECGGDAPQAESVTLLSQDGRNAEGFVRKGGGVLPAVAGSVDFSREASMATEAPKATATRPVGGDRSVAPDTGTQAVNVVAQNKPESTKETAAGGSIANSAPSGVSSRDVHER